MSDVEQGDDDVVENPEPEADFRGEDSQNPPNLNNNDGRLEGAEGNAEDELNIQNYDGAIEGDGSNGNNGAIDNSLAEGDQDISHGLECQNLLAEGDQHAGSVDVDDDNSPSLENNIDLPEGDVDSSIELPEGDVENNVELPEGDDNAEGQVNLAAEDEQYLRNNEVSFEGAEWSLEPEENSQNYNSNPEMDSGVGDAVESDQTGNFIGEMATESSSQLDNTGINPVANSNDINVQNNASGAPRVENEEPNSLTDEQDQENLLVAEEDRNLRMEQETIEADQEIQTERHGDDIEGQQLQSNQNNEGNIEGNRNIPVNVHTPSNQDSGDGVTPGNVRQVPEDEIGSLAPTEPVSMGTSESYQPECDQTAIKDNEIQSNPSVGTSEEAGLPPLVSDEFNVGGDVVNGEKELTGDSSEASDRDEMINHVSECDGKSNITENHLSHVNKQENCDNNATDSSKPKSVLNVQDLSLTSDKGAIPKQRQDSNSVSDTGLEKSKTNTEANNSKSANTVTKQRQVSSSVSDTGLKKSKSNTEASNTNSTNTVTNCKLESSMNNDIEDAEDALLSELDATLQSDSKTCDRPAETGSSSVSLDPADHVENSCEQCKQNNLKCSLTFTKGDNSNIPENVKEVKKQLHQAKNLLLERECQISRLKGDLDEKSERYQTAMLERDSYYKEVECLKAQNSDDLYIPQIKELEYTIAQQQNEVRSWKDKLASHDAAAKRAIATIQNEMKLRLDQMMKSCEEATKEKDSMVVKYAQAEHKNLEFKKQAERAEYKLREMEKERDVFLVKMKAVKDQRTKMGAEVETKNSEISHLNKELDKQRELASSADVRVKWSQNKLKAELEGHKETKVHLEKMNVKFKEAKEETQQIRADCQAIIKTYQESEEVKSNSLDKELKLKETELLVNLQEKTNWELAHVRTQRELEHVKGELRDSKSQCASLSEKISSLEGSLSQSSTTVEKYGEIIQRQKKEIQELRERIETLVQYRTDFTRSQELIKTLDAEISELKISNKDLVSEMEACKKREMDKLELTEKLTHKNVQLQSENTTMGNKVLTLTGELQSLKMENHGTDVKIKDLTDSLSTEQKLRREETQTLNTKLAGKCKAVEDLTRKLEEEKDEIKTVKRKHTNNLRDLTRQLQLVRRKLENYEAASTNGDKDTVSMGSRTSSNGSLNISEQPNTQVVQPNSTAPQTSNSVHNHTTPTEQEYPVITEQVEVDKQVLIERIVKLQRAMARKNEKLEFMDDHICHLVDEIQKKNKIIQSYILKEEGGTMTSDIRDRTKAEISRKHSIMGSVYSSHSNDGTMTLDLSLEINRKLQAVLEDTLLKNMTLKDNFETLGQEIARLSQENRQLQLKLQGLHKSSRGKGNPAVR